MHSSYFRCEVFRVRQAWFLPEFEASRNDKSRLYLDIDLGMEGIYEFEVKDMPVTVAVDSRGTNVHQTGPAEWQQGIAGIPILQ
jgi:hypothetical protein